MVEVSVIIPTKDRLPYLRQAIPRFLAHKEVTEVVVVIDGCKDGTLDYVEEAAATDSRIRYVDNVENKGLPYSRNRGIELASCDYVFTGEDDLELSDGFFATLIAHLEETGADVISGRNIFRHEHETKESAIARANRVSGPSINKRLITVQVELDTGSDSVQPLLPAPMLGRTEVFRKIRFDPDYRGVSWREESDFQVAAWEAGYKLVFCPHTISFNLVIENDRGGVHAAEGMRRAILIVKNNWYFLAKHPDAVAGEFEVTSLVRYKVRFAAWITFRTVIFPALLNAKRKIFGPRPWAWAQRIGF